jgi:Asp-tRNA(Asn)/Glu-tRNA(Gln) amidotransferase A subunit family amidase
MVLGILKIGKV